VPTPNPEARDALLVRSRARLGVRSDTEAVPVKGSPGGIALLVLGAVAALIGVAVPALDQATELAVVGAALAMVGSVLLLYPNVRHPVSDEPPLVGSPLVLLRDAFRSGPLGRQAIIATVVSLEASGRTTGAMGMSPDEERRLIQLDPRAFRAWLDDRLTRLENET
jgi:hypothetical protein